MHVFITCDVKTSDLHTESKTVHPFHSSVIRSQGTMKRFSCRAADRSISQRANRSGRQWRRLYHRRVEKWFSWHHWQSSPEQRALDRLLHCPASLSSVTLSSASITVSFVVRGHFETWFITCLSAGPPVTQLKHQSALIRLTKCQLIRGLLDGWLESLTFGWQPYLH